MDTAQEQPNTSSQGSPEVEGEAGRPARVVYTQAPVQLGRLIAAEGPRWRVAVGGVEATLAVDPAVDPALLADAARQGARVLVDAGPEPCIVGVVATQRSLVINEDDEVRARIARLELEVNEEAVLKTRASFLRLRTDDVELYAKRVVTRAREVAKVLARIVKIN